MSRSGQPIEPINLNTGKDRSSGHRITEPKPIGKILNDLVGDLGIDKKLAETRACLLWDNVVGEKLSSVTSVSSTRRGKLFVRVKTASWRNELLFLKERIIRRLNEKVGQNVVKDIVFLNEGR